METQRQNGVSKPRTGRPRRLTEEQRDHIYDLITSDPHIKTRDLEEEVAHVVKERSIRRLPKKTARRNLY